MRKVFLTVVLCLLTTAFGSHTPQAQKRNRIILIPLDSRPAAGQFAQMIGAMNDTRVDVPPVDILGKFTTPGDVEKIFKWLENQQLSDVDTIIVSSDMIAYGGLVASRVNDIDAGNAIKRLQRLMDFKKKAPDVKLFIYAATMRLTPTATKSTASYRVNLARYEEMKDRYERTGDASIPPKLSNLRKMVPAVEILRYERTRRRNFEVQSALLRMSIGKDIDFLIMGQDDAKPDGPQIQENAKLKKLSAQYGVNEKVYFCEGIDQHSNLLLSRAILAQRGWKPKVRIVYSDEAGKDQYAMYESKTVKESLQDQLYASGAEMAKDTDEYDYSLYVNTPKRRDQPFQSFLESLRSEIDQGFPVAVADINFGANGASDEELFSFLVRTGKSFKLLAFAGWNTAGNTMGTAIPSANVYLCARKYDVDPYKRELAQREFLLHRMIDDWAYHKFTRPATYQMIDALQDQRDEIYGSNYDAVDKFAGNDLRKYIRQIFLSQFQYRRFYAGTKEYQIMDIDGLRINLPWPRAYEIKVDFKLRAEETTPGSGN